MRRSPTARSGSATTRRRPRPTARRPTTSTATRRSNSPAPSRSSGAGRATTASATTCTTSPSATCGSSTSASTSTTTAGRRARATSSGRAWGPRSSTTASITSARSIERADVIDAVVELLGPHARPLDVARALRPAVVVDVEALVDDPQVALGEVVHVVAEAVVARPAPDERDGAGEFDRLVAVEVVGLRAVGRGRLRVMAEPDRAVGDRLVHDDPRAVVQDIGDVAQRAQVILGHLELPERR